MPCMCGDLYCHSCGPAQGNYRCGVCGRWDADGGCVRPEECRETAKQWAEEDAEVDYDELDHWKDDYVDPS